MATYEGKYPNSLFNKGVRAKNEDHVGHVMKETPDKIMVFGSYNHRFDIPKSEIYHVGANVILKIDFPEIYKYEVNMGDPLQLASTLIQSTERHIQKRTMTSEIYLLHIKQL